MFFSLPLSPSLPPLSYTPAGILCFPYKPCQFNYWLNLGTCARVTAAILCVCVCVCVCMSRSVITLAATSLPIIICTISLIPRPHALEHMHCTMHLLLLKNSKINACMLSMSLVYTQNNSLIPRLPDLTTFLCITFKTWERPVDESIK